MNTSEGLESSYIVQNHDNLSPSINSPPIDIYPSANIALHHHHHHHHHQQLSHPNSLLSQLPHPNEIHHNVGDTILASNDGNLNYYSTSLNPQPTGLPHQLTPFPTERGNITANLYGLVTPSPLVNNPSPYPVHIRPQTIITSPENGAAISHHNRENHRNRSTSSNSSYPLPPSSPHPHTHQHSYPHPQFGTSPSDVMTEASISSSSLSSPYSVQREEGPCSKRFRHQHHHHNSSPSSVHHHRRRKKMSSTTMVGSDHDDDTETCSSRHTTTPTDDSSKKQNHSEIEKRRRDKMNTYITELSGMVPMCNAMSRKLDKLTVLRMAVQHMKTMRGSRIHSYTEGHYKPSFLTDEELKNLILQSAEGFLFVVGCDRGRILYVSESVSQVLNYTPAELLSQSWFDFLHPKDVAKVKEQLSSSDLAPRERLIDAKTMLPVKGNVPQKTNRLCPGARRSFFCRMKCRSSSLIKEELQAGEVSPASSQQKKRKCSERKFCVIHCTGYLKSWAKIGIEDSEAESDDPCNLSCLVAIGRILKPIITAPFDSKYTSVTFMSRHGIDGKFVFVDQRATLIVGFLPQELLGTSMYEYFHHDDIASLADVHKAVLSSNESMTTQFYRFKTKNGNCVRLQSIWKAFRNPWTKEIEYIISKNIVIPNEDADDFIPEGAPVGVPTQIPVEFDFFTDNNGHGVGNGDIQRLIRSEVPFRKIGEQIADEVVEGQRRNDSSSSNSSSSVLDSSNLDPSSCITSDLNLPPMLPTCVQTNILQPIPASHSPTASSQRSHSGTQRPVLIPLGMMGSSPAVINNGERNGDLRISSGANDPLMGSTVCMNNRAMRENYDNHAIQNLRDDELMYTIGDGSSTNYVPPSEGNDEAAMAVIMSLLEADAGLGGPVDLSGLPWPLP